MGFLGLGRPTALTVLAHSLQLPKCSLGDSTSPVELARLTGKLRLADSLSPISAVGLLRL